MKIPVEVSIDSRRFTKYLNRFIQLDCTVDLLMHSFRWNAKEVSETVGAYMAVLEHVRANPSDESVTCYVVGDGKYPRTGAFIAHMTKWNVISIDPQCIYNGEVPRINRLTCIRQKSQDVELPPVQKAVIVHVHSHAPLVETLDRLTAIESRSMVSIPCCIPHDQIPADYEYTDFGILSEKNIVKIWKKV